MITGKENKHCFVSKMHTQTLRILKNHVTVITFKQERKKEQGKRERDIL